MVLSSIFVTAPPTVSRIDGPISIETAMEARHDFDGEGRVADDDSEEGYYSDEKGSPSMILPNGSSIQSSMTSVWKIPELSVSGPSSPSTDPTESSLHPLIVPL